MAFVVKDRVQETTTTTGTGTITLAGAVSGFQSFSAIGNGNTTFYTIVGTTEWEVGIGTYTSSGTTLSRDAILSSSNSGNAVSFSAGAKQVFVTLPASKSITTTSDTAPTNPTAGDNWYNTTDGTLYVYYSSTWVDVSSFSNMLPSQIGLDGGIANANSNNVELTLDAGNAPFTNFPLQSVFDNGYGTTFGYQNSIDGGVSSTAYNVFGSAIDCGLAL